MHPTIILLWCLNWPNTSNKTFLCDLSLTRLHSPATVVFIEADTLSDTAGDTVDTIGDTVDTLDDMDDMVEDIVGDIVGDTVEDTVDDIVGDKDILVDRRDEVTV